jgi:hypothetical protein
MQKQPKMNMKLLLDFVLLLLFLLHLETQTMIRRLLSFLPGLYRSRASDQMRNRLKMDCTLDQIRWQTLRAPTPRSRFRPWS